MCEETVSASVGLISAFARKVSAPANPAVSDSAPVSETDHRALLEYRRHVLAAARERRRALVNNSSPGHFVIVMEQLLQLAARRVRIFSNHLSRYARVGHGGTGDGALGQLVWADDHIRNAATRFLAQPGSRLDIIVRNDLDADDGDLSNHDFLRDLIAAPSRQGLVTLRIANAGNNPGLKMFSRNFVVVDEAAYRHETNHDAIRALVQFGDDGSAGLFVRVFDQMADEVDRLVLSNAAHPAAFSSYFPASLRDVNSPIVLTRDAQISSPEVFSSYDATSAAA